MSAASLHFPIYCFIANYYVVDVLRALSLVILKKFITYFAVRSFDFSCGHSEFLPLANLNWIDDLVKSIAEVPNEDALEEGVVLVVYLGISQLREHSTDGQVDHRGVGKLSGLRKQGGVGCDV